MKGSTWNFLWSNTAVQDGNAFVKLFIHCLSTAGGVKNIIPSAQLFWAATERADTIILHLNRSGTGRFEIRANFTRLSQLIFLVLHFQWNSRLERSNSYPGLVWIIRLSGRPYDWCPHPFIKFLYPNVNKADEDTAPLQSSIYSLDKWKVL